MFLRILNWEFTGHRAKASSRLPEWWILVLVVWNEVSGKVCSRRKKGWECQKGSQKEGATVFVHSSTCLSLKSA